MMMGFFKLKSPLSSKRSSAFQSIPRGKKKRVFTIKFYKVVSIILLLLKKNLNVLNLEKK